MLAHQPRDDHEDRSPLRRRAITAAVVGTLLFYLSFSHFRHPLPSPHQASTPPAASLTQHTPLLAQFNQAKAYYDRGAYHLAHGLFKDDEAGFFELAEGCELMISVTAELKRLSSLERIARRCLELDQSVPIAAEGLAMALSHLGRARAAITALEAVVAKHPHDRVWAALSQLSLYEDQIDEAQFYLAKAMAASPIWSVWLDRLLRQPKLHSPTYLSEIAKLIATKPQVRQAQERALRDLLLEHNLITAAELIEARMQQP